MKERTTVPSTKIQTLQVTQIRLDTELQPMQEQVLALKELLSFTSVLTTSENVQCSQEIQKD